jgi:hypothetical protein
MSRITSWAPAEQRDLIDTVLREKTNLNSENGGRSTPPDQPLTVVGHVE